MLRKAGARATVFLYYSKEDETWTLRYKIAFKGGELKFKFGDEFDEITPDGRLVKVGKIKWQEYFTCFDRSQLLYIVFVVCIGISSIFTSL